MLTENAEVFRVQPLCGPKDGNSKVKLFGRGFVEQNETVFSKFGTIAVQSLDKDKVTQEAWSSKNYLNSLLMTVSDLATFQHLEHPLTEDVKVQAITVQAPPTPSKEQTLGGPVYLAVGHHIATKDPFSPNSAAESVIYKYSNSLAEYYYYK